MSLTLTITDNANGTGATATIAGGANLTNAFFTTPVSGEIGALGTWTAAGSRVGNGSLVLPLAAGLHFVTFSFYSMGGDSQYWRPVLAVVTDGVASVYYRILQAVQARLRLLGLATIQSANIVVREVAIDRDLTLPAVAIAPQRPAMSATGGVLGFNDKVYGVLVALYAADNQVHTNTDLYAKWMEQVENAFHNKRLTGVAEVITAEVMPGDAIPLEVWRANKYMGLILLKFTSRESAA